jgi:hypothetical protein
MSRGPTSFNNFRALVQLTWRTSDQSCNTQKNIKQRREVCQYDLLTTYTHPPHMPQNPIQKKIRKETSSSTKRQHYPIRQIPPHSRFPYFHVSPVLKTTSYNPGKEIFIKRLKTRTLKTRLCLDEITAHSVFISCTAFEVAVKGVRDIEDALDVSHA